MSTSHCFHCGDHLPAGQPIIANIRDEQQLVCCLGCKAVSEFIANSDLNTFYQHRDLPSADSTIRPIEAEWTNYDSAELRQRYVFSNQNTASASMDISGMYCSACVWLLQKSLQRLSGIRSIDVNPATHRAVISWQDESHKFSEILEAIASVGFKPSPIVPGEKSEAGIREHRTALKRLIVAAAAGMQVMMFAVAMYAGDYFGIDAEIEKFLRVTSLLVTLPIITYAAKPFFFAAWRGLRAGTPGMDVPVTVAILAAFIVSTIATFTEQGHIYFDSIAMFVFFLSSTRYLEMRARHKSDDYAVALAKLLPDTVVQVNNSIDQTVPLDRICENDFIRLKPGDIVPTDGVISSGSLLVDESFMTGESRPRSLETGSQALAGSLIAEGSGVLKVSRVGAATNLAEIGRLLEKSAAERTPLSNLSETVGKYFAVAAISVASIAGLVWYFIDPGRAFAVALSTLVVTCPCALALATPAAIAAATSTLAKQGFLSVSNRILQVLAQPVTFIFDKTGTLTEGQPEIVNVHLNDDVDISKEEALSIAAHLETYSEHVLARAFRNIDTSSLPEATDIRILPGQGIAASIHSEQYQIGSLMFAGDDKQSEFLQRHSSPHTSHIYLRNSKGVMAMFELQDTLRSDAKTVLDQLKKQGAESVIISGDSQEIVQTTAESLSVNHWHAEQKPADKLELMKSMKSNGQKIVAVGDGINDALILSAADTSIAIGSGTALARASADAVLMGDKLGKILDAVTMAKKMHRTIRQNIIWAISYNITAIPLAVSGILSPWMAALGMSLSSLIVVTNALRLRYHEAAPRSSLD